MSNCLFFFSMGVDDLASSVDINIRKGPIKICYTDEVPDDEGSEKGFLARLLGLSFCSS